MLWMKMKSKKPLLILSPAEAAALPLTGLTGWRALVTEEREC